MSVLNSTVVLLVEDDAGDQKLIKRAFENLGIPTCLYVTGSAEEALIFMDYCKQADGQSNRPNLILLDLNMPGMGGKEFLRRIKADNDLCDIPVVVLTVSDLDTDIYESYNLRAAGYIQKPAVASQLEQAIAKWAKYWFETASLVKNSK